MSRDATVPPDTLPSPNLRDVGELVGSAEIAAMFGGISRQRVYQLTSRPDFPEPFQRLKAGAVWRTTDVVEWAEARGRTVQEEP